MLFKLKALIIASLLGPTQYCVTTRIASGVCADSFVSNHTLMPYTEICHASGPKATSVTYIDRDFSTDYILCEYCIVCEAQ